MLLSLKDSSQLPPSSQLPAPSSQLPAPSFGAPSSFFPSTSSNLQATSSIPGCLPDSSVGAPASAYRKRRGSGARSKGKRSSKQGKQVKPADKLLVNKSYKEVVMKRTLSLSSDVPRYLKKFLARFVGLTVAGVVSAANIRFALRWVNHS